MIPLGFHRARAFPTTNWRLVLASRRPGTIDTRDSIAELCAIYWYPVYAFLRRRGYRAEAAEDLAQGFFAHILGNALLARAQPEKGRLRSLLLTSLTNFVANQHQRQLAQKRHSAAPPVRVDVMEAEARYAREPADPLTPERLYERQWATTLLTRVLDRLRDEFAAAGKGHTFDVLKGQLVGDIDDTGYRHAADALATTVGAVRVAVHRLRRRYREMLRDEIGRTVDGSDREIDDEIRYLFSVMRS